MNVNERRMPCKCTDHFDTEFPVTNRMNSSSARSKLVPRGTSWTIATSKNLITPLIKLVLIPDMRSRTQESSVSVINPAPPDTRASSSEICVSHGI